MDEVTIPKCQGCNGVFDPEHPEDIYVQRDGEGRAVFQMHMKCAMQAEIQQKNQLLNNLTAVFLGVLYKYGGTVRVTKEEIDAGINAGAGNVNVKQEKSALTGEPGDFIASCGKPNDRLIVPASAMPSRVKLN